MLQKSSPAENMKERKKEMKIRNDANNEDDTPNVHHSASHPVSDDCNKESCKNTSLDGSDKSTNQKFANNTSYSCSEGVMKCLLFLIYYLKQFVHYQEYQDSDGKIIYQYTTCLAIVSVCFDMEAIQKLHSMIRLWKELCNIVVQYWPEGVECLEEVSDDEIQRWKKVEQAVLLQCCRGLCCTTSVPAILQYWDLDHFFPLPVDLNWLDNPCNFFTLQIAKFGNRFFNDVLLVHNITSTRLTAPNLFVSIFGSFPGHHKLLKSFSDVGRQASDNGKRSQRETSQRSGSAGSNTSSSTTGGGQYGNIKRTGSTGSCGSPGKGDDEEDGERKRDRPSRTSTYNTPCVMQWVEKEEDSENQNETASLATTAPENQNEAASLATTAPWPSSRDDLCSESGKTKTTKSPHKTAAPITYELAIRCGNGLDMFAVTSPMMNLPLSGDDDPFDELPYAATVASNEIFTIRCRCEGYHDRLLYCDEVPRSFKSLQMLCLPVYYCEPVVAQATDEVVQPPRHSTNTSETVSVESLLPPPGGGSDIQFKDTLMILCTVVAAVYYNLYNDRCYFDCDDLNVHKLFVTRDLDTGKAISVSIHAMLRQLEDHGEDAYEVGEDIKMICEGSRQSIRLCNDAYERLQDDDKCARAVEDKSRRACKGTCKAKFFAVVNYCLDTDGFPTHDDFKITCGAGNIQNLGYFALLLAVLTAVTVTN